MLWKSSWLEESIMTMHGVKYKEYKSRSLLCTISVHRRLENTCHDVALRGLLPKI